MRILFIGSTLRSLENLGSVPDILRSRGHQTLSILYPTPNDKTHDIQRLKGNTGLFLLEHDQTTLGGYIWSARSEKFLHALAEKIEEFGPDIIVLTVNTLPFATLRSDLQPLLKRERLWVGFQHGLVQRWGEMNRQDTCDVVLTFGERDRLRLAPAKRARSVAVGFPKLDRLAEMSVTDEQFILYATDARSETIMPISRLLAELEEHTGLPVYVRNHPVSKGAYRSSPTRARDPALQALVEAEDPIPAVARCSALITHYSTLGVEALALGKPLVVLPLDEALDTFDGLPGLASSLDTTDVVQALGAAHAQKDRAGSLLRDLVGASPSGHSARMADTLEALAGSKDTRLDSRPSGIAMPLPTRLAVSFSYDPAKRVFRTSGFVLADPPARNVTLRYRGQPLGTAEVILRRTDLETAFPEYGHVFSGWSLSCDLAEWPAGILDVEVQDIEGGTSHHRVQVRLPVPA